MASGISQLGSIIGAFAKPKLNQVFYSDPLNKQQTATTDSLAGYRASQAADLAKYGLALDQATGEIKALSAGDNATLSGLIDSSKEDPFQTFKNIGDYKTSVLDKLAKNLGDQGRAQDNLLLARFGGGGRSNGTYQTNSIIDRLSRNLAPVYAGTLSGLAGDTSAIVGGRTQNSQNITNLLNARAGIPLRTLPLQTATQDQRTQNLADEIAAEGQLGQNFRGNSAGFKEQKSTAGAIGDALDSSLNSAVDTGMSLYTGGLGGGGGILSMLGGGGGGRAQTPNAGTFIQQGGIGGNNAGLLKGLVNNGSGGTNNQAIIALLSQLLNSNGN